MRNAKWDVSNGIDFDLFDTGATFTFVRAVAEQTCTPEFKFEAYGFLDSQGRFYLVGHSTELPDTTQHIGQKDE